MLARHRRLLALVGLGLVGAAAIAAGAVSLQAWRIGRALEAELEMLHEAGFLPVTPSPGNEPPELRAAREQLADLLTRVERADTLEDGIAFGGPGMLDAADPAAETRVAAGLRLRADLLAEFDVLPDVLWNAAGEPFDPRRFLIQGVRVSDNLRALRSTTNLMCAAAWMHARETSAGAEAGHWIARALALARITDGGDASELVLRASMETIALECVEALREEGIVEAAELEAPVREQLARIDDVARLRLALRCDLARYEVMLDLPRRPFRPAFGLRFLLDEMRWRRELLETGLPEGWRACAGRDWRNAVEDEKWLGHFATILAVRESKRARVLRDG